jgi:hypothetical protein
MIKNRNRLTRLFSGLLLFCAPMGGLRAEVPASIAPLTVTRGELGGGRFYAAVRFDNVMGTMRLDTGASTSRITRAPWNEGLRTVGKTVSTAATGGSMHCDDVEAKNVFLKVSKGNAIGRAGYVVSRCPAGAGEDLLGLDFFKGARFRIDPKHRTLIFTDAQDSSDRMRNFRLLGPERRLVGIEAKIGDTPAIGLFDTGAEISAVDLKFVQSHKNLFTPTKARVHATDAGGGKWSPSVYRVKSIDIGDNHILQNVYVIAYDFGVLREALGPQTPLILGVNLIGKLQWDLDLHDMSAPSWRARPQ